MYHEGVVIPLPFGKNAVNFNPSFVHDDLVFKGL